MPLIRAPQIPFPPTPESIRQLNVYLQSIEGAGRVGGAQGGPIAVTMGPGQLQFNFGLDPNNELYGKIVDGKGIGSGNPLYSWVQVNPFWDLNSEVFQWEVVDNGGAGTYNGDHPAREIDGRDAVPTDGSYIAILKRGAIHTDLDTQEWNFRYSPTPGSSKSCNPVPIFESEVRFELSETGSWCLVLYKRGIWLNIDPTTGCLVRLVTNWFPYSTPFCVSDLVNIIISQFTLINLICSSCQTTGTGSGSGSGSGICVPGICSDCTDPGGPPQYWKIFPTSFGGICSIFNHLWFLFQVGPCTWQSAQSFNGGSATAIVTLVVVLPSAASLTFKIQQGATTTTVAAYSAIINPSGRCCQDLQFSLNGGSCMCDDSSGIGQKCGYCISNAPKSWSLHLEGGTGCYTSLNGDYIIDIQDGCLWVTDDVYAGVFITLEITANGVILTVTAPGGVSVVYRTWEVINLGSFDCCNPVLGLPTWTATCSNPDPHGSNCAPGSTLGAGFCNQDAAAVQPSCNNDVGTCQSNIAATPRCCSGVGSGSGSGSGGGTGVTTSCCVNKICNQLVVTLIDGGGCACAAGSYTLTYDGIVGGWTGTYTVCGATWKFVLQCKVPPFGWHMTIQCGASPPIDVGSATDSTCNPFTLVFPRNGLWGACCPGGKLGAIVMFASCCNANGTGC